MSTYKVPQDVEAEDKLVGPFTLKQFIYLIVAAISGYLTFVLATLNPVLVLLTLPFTIIFSILGVFRREDQPVELYLAALIRFHLKPRRRLWDQDGIMEPVQITAPPKVEHRYTDGLSQREVTSRLKVLANTMDTRGWSSKNANLQVPAQSGFAQSDRLVRAQDIAQYNQPTEIHASDDMMDFSNNVVAQSVNAMSQTATQQMHQQALTNMYPVPQPVRSQQQIAPVYQPPQAAQLPRETTSTMTSQPTPDIIRLAQNSDFNVSTIARQADQSGRSLEDDTEISLR